MIQKDALEYLLDSASRRARESALGVEDTNRHRRAFLYNDAKCCYDEVIPLDRAPMLMKFGTVDSLADFLLAELAEDRASLRDTLLHVASDGISAALDIADPRRRDVVRIPFFDDDLPKQGYMSYEDFLLYLDRHTGALTDEQSIRAALRSVRVSKDAGIVISERGAATELRVQAKKVTEGVDDAGMAVSLPKFLHLELRYGTRLHTQTLTFRLLVKDGGGTPLFCLEHVDRDEARTHWIAETTVELKAKLPGWRVYEGV